MLKSKLILQALIGDDLGDCKLEAVLTCAKEAVDVEFEFNGSRFLVRVEDLRRVVKEQEK